MAEHRVGFRQFLGAAADGFEILAECFGDLGEFGLGVRQEFVQRRIEQTDGDRQPAMMRNSSMKSWRWNGSSLASAIRGGRARRWP